MKNLFAILSVITLLFISGCQEKILPPAGDMSKKYEVVVIDSCEYIRWLSSGSNSGGTTRQDMLIHKGNCSNPVHKK